MSNFYNEPTKEELTELFCNFDENYKRIKEKFDNAVLKSGRKEGDVTLSVASKTVAPEILNYAHSKGIEVMGENKVQELLSKWDNLDKSIDMQFIGRLQSNKVKYIVDKVSLIQSVDSLKLAGEISKRSNAIGKVMPVLVEINVGGEDSKGGITPESAYEFIDEIKAFSGISVKGLMTIGPLSSQLSQNFEFFSKMHQLFVDIRTKKVDNVSMEILSMGMSGDFERAILEGSTQVRIGSALFGPRNYN